MGAKNRFITYSVDATDLFTTCLLGKTRRKETPQESRYSGVDLATTCLAPMAKAEMPRISTTLIRLYRFNATSVKVPKTKKKKRKKKSKRIPGTSLTTNLGELNYVAQHKFHLGKRNKGSLPTSNFCLATTFSSPGMGKKMEAITDFREIISHCTRNTNKTTSIISFSLIVTLKSSWLIQNDAKPMINYENAS